MHQFHLGRLEEGGRDVSSECGAKRPDVDDVA
jgi:hypothetical protein